MAGRIIEKAPWLGIFFRERLLLVLLAALPVLVWLAPVPVRDYAGLVQWHTLAALAGLMLLSRGLEFSTYLDAFGRWLACRAGTQRRLAAVLVCFAALLSAIVTNDVALFIVIPITLGICRMANISPQALVIFLALAVNAGSSASPVGNPQNLFIWQSAGTGFFEFMFAMLPLACLLMLLLFALIPLAFRDRTIQVTDTLPDAPRDKPLFLVSLLLYVPFLAAIEFGMAPLGMILLLLLYLRFRPGVARGTDWILLLVFLLMFLDLGLLATLPVVAQGVAMGQSLPGGELLTAALLSQFISNVPAAILLFPHTDDWRALAWGVSVGGFGLAIGSMANLIALRMAAGPGLWVRFHLWSIPVFFAALVLAIAAF